MTAAENLQEGYIQIISSPALRAFFGSAELWQLRVAEQMAVAPSPPSSSGSMRMSSCRRQVGADSLSAGEPKGPADAFAAAPSAGTASTARRPHQPARRSLEPVLRSLEPTRRSLKRSRRSSRGAHTRSASRSFANRMSQTGRQRTVLATMNNSRQAPNAISAQDPHWPTSQASWLSVTLIASISGFMIRIRAHALPIRHSSAQNV